MPLDAWAAERGGGQTAPRIPQEASELLLFEALHDYPALADADSRWQLAESLLSTFAELGDAPVRLPEDHDAFRQRLQTAYGAPEHLAGPVSREARLVHEVWHIWRDQLAGEGLQDAADARGAALEAALATLAPGEHLVLLAPERVSATQARALAPLIANGRATVIVHGMAPGTAGEPARRLAADLGLEPAPPPEADWVDAALPADLERPPLAARAASWHGPPPGEAWRHVIARDEEQEARAVALAAVQTRADSSGRVVIATENRRLARRLRALLERFGLALADEGGWALSTTSAAALVERWLECVEQSFDWRPLLDVLKSPFLAPAPDASRDAHDTVVYQFERDLVRHEGITRGVAAYLAALRARSSRLGAWSAGERRLLRRLLARLRHAARPLERLRDGRTRDARAWVEALRASLERLGSDDVLAADAAGERVLAVLARLERAAAGRNVRLGWNDFRTWCGRALEQEPFVAPGADASVVLADLARAADTACDCLILAGADSDHLPGGPGGTPFFNDAVRADLGLPTWPDRWRLQLHRLRRALGLAGRVVISHARERDGEPVTPSPWIELLATFHELAFGAPAGDGGLVSASEAFDRAHREALPGVTARPAPAAPVALLPERLSASRHQDLVACPYRFFAATCLGLEAREEIREELQKAEYGERLHRALQAFWTPVNGMPAPWTGPLDDAHRAGALAHLETLIGAAFEQPGEAHFGDRAWRRRALGLAPALIDWAIGRAAQATFVQAETHAARSIDETLKLQGRLDRIDRMESGAHAVIDYKTGRPPDADVIRAGEDVQLATYALVGEDVAAAAYLELHRDGCRERPAGGIQGAELAELARAVERRLAHVWASLQAGEAMPAWDNPRCAWCDMEGLCRRPAWRGETRSSTPQSSA